MKSSRKPMPSRFSFQLALPRGYKATDAVHFHGRDKEAVSEVVTDVALRKGILLDGVPTVFDIEFEPLKASVLIQGVAEPALPVRQRRPLEGAREAGRGWASPAGPAAKKHAACTVSADGKLTDAMRAQARDIVLGLLGLRLDPRRFAAFVAADPIFGPLAKKQKTLRIVQASSVYEALTWAVMGQQINVAFAVTLRRTFIQLAGRRHSSGLWCYPSPADAARLPIEELTSRQYSRSKAETILRLSALVASGELDLVESAANPVESICAALLAVKGIGPWTVNYAMLRGFGQPDCSLHGDVAVRSAIGRLWGLETRPGIAETEEFLKRYSPHRTMAAAHLWASLSAKAY
ncbi:DNA-3-methyladenine glycosylase family protein [Achromobacter aloeverae]